VLRVVRERRRLARSMRADRDSLAADRRKRLNRLVQHAYRWTHYYRRRFDEAGISPDMIRSEADLPLIPPASRAELQAAGPEALTSRAFDRRHLVIEKTSGSSGRPLELYVDRTWVATRNAMFLRALGASGYRPPQKMVLLTSGPARDRPWPLRWRYVPFDTSPDVVVEQVRQFAPTVLYGWVTPLRRLAERLRESGGDMPSVRAVVATAETLDVRTRRLLEARIGAEVFQIYGLTEMGAVGWECRAHDGLHVAEESTIVESVDGRLLLTNLGLLATPLLRYDCGDLADWHEDAECACGCGYRRLARVEGREVDCVRLRDGRVISPYQFTLALEGIRSLATYQVVQETLDRIEVKYVLRGPDPEVSGRVRSALAGLVGPEIAIVPEELRDLTPEPGRKFRVVERRIEHGR
jgi:phenylacetate-CoA ligase